MRSTAVTGAEGSADGDRAPGRSARPVLGLFAVSFLLLLGLQGAEVARVHGGDLTGPFLVAARAAESAHGWPMPVRAAPLPSDN